MAGLLHTFRRHFAVLTKFLDMGPESRPYWPGGGILPGEGYWTAERAPEVQGTGVGGPVARASEPQMYHPLQPLQGLPGPAPLYI